MIASGGIPRALWQLQTGDEAPFTQNWFYYRVLCLKHLHSTGSTSGLFFSIMKAEFTELHTSKHHGAFGRLPEAHDAYGTKGADHHLSGFHQGKIKLTSDLV
ncbi:hypothetical protein CEXT_328671 [Caerostris extrusa]|uniref:Uncharacterized protein n=1 Tax=Caerostris extrusa TaxID=172846 RepID=A0AAV4V7U4_CAEEX|nr:hypothetical protein CEXT_328671 [Caerostris extrusa]